MAVKAQEHIKDVRNGREGKPGFSFSATSPAKHTDRISHMIGLILVTHGRLADQFVEAMEHVVGKQSAIETVCIGPNDDMEQRRSEIASGIAKVDAGEGVIILTDLFGGTPSNLAISLLEAGQVEVIAGINLPMLIRLAGARKKMSVTQAVEAAQEAGRNYITVASELLGQESAAKPAAAGG
jgi:PTS system mannose-specific IIA component